jgi:hypothetical protein
MKKGILITVIGIIIIGIAYFGIKKYDFVKEVKSDSLKEIKKTEYSHYQNSELSLFYKNFEKEIIETIWSDEPPGKLSGVIFRIGGKKYIEIELDSIPELYKMNLALNWKIDEVGNSRIRNIKLVEEN